MNELNWCEVDRAALAANASQLRAIVGDDTLLAPVVKGNAYGHGLLLAARAFVEAGADWLCVNALFEAEKLRDGGIRVPIYVLGRIPPGDIPAALDLGCQLVVYDEQTIREASRAARGRVGDSALSSLSDARPARLHLKLETGNNRQGIREDEAARLATLIDEDPALEFTGLATHFADVEDTTDHTFAKAQIARFCQFADQLEARGIAPRYKHVSNSAATILWPDSHMGLVRAGIACYGMWPSTEAYVSALVAGRARIELTPALTFKSQVAQVREVPAGEYIGYGRTFRTTHTTRVAVLPVGYYDGYPRGLSNLAHVLIRGHRAQVRGRVCMNITTVDVTDIEGVTAGDEVVLLGCQGEESITAEQIAEWAGTINYEITTRINERIPRIAV